MTAALQIAVDAYADYRLRAIEAQADIDEAIENEANRLAAQIVTDERRMLAMIDSADLELDVPMLRNPLTGEVLTLLQVMVTEFAREARYQPSWATRALATHLAEHSAAVDAQARANVEGE